jgi:cytochrome c oxidase assembly factor CtaG
LLWFALVFPLPTWSSYLLSARSIQNIALCMAAPPLLWIAFPFHIFARALPVSAPFRTGWLYHLLLPVLRAATQPFAAWIIFLGAILFWHNPEVADWILTNAWGRCLAPWLLFLIGLLYWRNIVATDPRSAAMPPGWGVVPYLIGIEIPNMATGVTIAFSQTPLYPAYQAARAAGFSWPLSVLDDQMTAGALIWVTGSFVYFSAIIAAVYRLFAHEGSTAPRPAPNWDAHERMIAPGLEHRARENIRRNVDLSHH